MDSVIILTIGQLSGFIMKKAWGNRKVNINSKFLVLELCGI